jgi:hypothetical protein
MKPATIFLCLLCAACAHAPQRPTPELRERAAAQERSPATNASSTA